MGVTHYACMQVLELPAVDDMAGDSLMDAPLSEFLADSVTAVRLAAAINAEFGRGAGAANRLPPTALLAPDATLASVAALMSTAEGGQEGHGRRRILLKGGWMYIM